MVLRLSSTVKISYMLNGLLLKLGRWEEELLTRLETIILWSSFINILSKGKSLKFFLLDVFWPLFCKLTGLSSSLNDSLLLNAECPKSLVPISRKVTRFGGWLVEWVQPYQGSNEVVYSSTHWCASLLPYENSWWVPFCIRWSNDN